ncbi:MAG: hypothetical protein JNM40_21255 [Myxococcales bacterium]|nr:hypothetical protein [Myxococcales bacterium]
MLSDQERSRHNLNLLSNLLDEHNPVEGAATELVRRFHRRSRYLVLAIGIGKGPTDDGLARWIIVTPRQISHRRRMQPRRAP